MFIIKYRVSLFPTLLTFGDQLDSARQVFNLQYFDPQVVSCSAMATAIFDDRRLRPFRVWLVEYLKLVYILHIYIYISLYICFFLVFGGWFPYPCVLRCGWDYQGMENGSSPGCSSGGLVLATYRLQTVLVFADVVQYGPGEFMHFCTMHVIMGLGLGWGCNDVVMWCKTCCDVTPEMGLGLWWGCNDVDVM